MTRSEYDRIVRRMIEAAGHATQSLGVGRLLGQIFRYLYFSREPRSLDSLTAALGISKGSASMGVRQLEQWGGVKKVSVAGDRKDYYVAKDALGTIIRNATLEIAGKRMDNSSALISETEAELTTRLERAGEMSEEERFIKDRIEKLRSFQRKTEGIWDGIILRMLLK